MSAEERGRRRGLREARAIVMAAEHETRSPRAEEREACAAICDELALGAPNLLLQRACHDIAKLIRARGKAGEEVEDWAVVILAILDMGLKPKVRDIGVRRKR